MNKFSLYVLFIFILSGSFISTLSADEPSQKAFEQPSTLSSAQRPTAQEEDILYEIERINQKIEKLEGSGEISGTTKLAIVGILGTIVYGVVHGHLTWMFNPEFYLAKGIAVVEGSAWINAVLRGVVDTAIPGLAIGTLLGFANEYPDNLPGLNLETEDLVKVGVISIVSTLAATTLLATTCVALSSNCLSFGSRMFIAAFYTMPVMAIILVANIYQQRVNLKTLQIQLKEAHDTLAERRKLANQQAQALPAPA
ncbi:hypothetical protein [Endozoicomonas ascidiicola]|uniref:hypothetical protein n=1 Tax=Endozoicomonas ascidiicola TaxID=1698521 RepID=UPI000831C85C|nr:hypothetical protein [Endozoicomonas ascidiicola]